MGECTPSKRGRKSRKKKTPNSGNMDSHAREMERITRIMVKENYRRSLWFHHREKPTHIRVDWKVIDDLFSRS